MITVKPWTANGVHLLTEVPAAYACDSCGSLAQMPSIARLRLAWTVPLTPARNHPPIGNAFT